MFWRPPRSEIVGVVGVWVGVVLAVGGAEVGIVGDEEVSFTGVDSKGVVTEPELRLKLVEAADDALEGSDAGTTPLVPVRPSQRPWHAYVVEPEPVVPG